jgi:hypothetical protein
MIKTGIFLDRQQEMNNFFSKHFGLPFQECNEDVYFNSDVFDSLNKMSESEKLKLHEDFYIGTLFISIAELSFLYKIERHSNKDHNSLVEDRLKKMVYSFSSEGIRYFLNMKNLKNIFFINYNLPEPQRPSSFNVIKMARCLGYTLVDPMAINDIATMRMDSYGSEEVNISCKGITMIFSISTFRWSYQNIHSFKSILRLNLSEDVLATPNYITVEEKVRFILKRKPKSNLEDISLRVKKFLEFLDYPYYDVDGELKYLDTQEFFELISTYIYKSRFHNAV